MKTLIKLFFVLFLVNITILSLSAAENQYYADTDVANLISGIKSDNNGLMRSSIYFAGKYKIEETTDALLEVLNSESDPSNVILIALAIYQMGDKEAMMHVLDVAKNSSNNRVKHMLSAIALQYLAESNIQYVLR